MPKFKHTNSNKYQKIRVIRKTYSMKGSDKRVSSEAWKIAFVLSGKHVERGG